MSPALDGVGRLILKIAKAHALRSNREIEDVFSDAVVLYLTNKHKWDPSRGKLTTFVGILLRCKLSRKTPQSRTAPIRSDFDKMIVADYDDDTVELSPLATETLTYLSTLKQGNLAPITLQKKLGWTAQKAEDVFAELRANLDRSKQKASLYFVSNKELADA